MFIILQVLLTADNLRAIIYALLTYKQPIKGYMKTPIEALQWRYATKQFDPTKKLSDEQLNTLEEALRLAPSSFGLQPWTFVVVSNSEIRTQLSAAAWAQPQITEASHLIVFTVRTDINDAFVDEYIASVAATRSIPTEQLKGYSDMIKGSIAAKSPEQLKEWAARQAYLALGTFLTTAAMQEIDACPMEGFDPEKFDQMLDLQEKGLHAVVLAAVGFRAADDQAAAVQKVRFPKEQVILEVK